MAVDKILFGNSSYQLLRGALDASALRQKVIADNVANAETPGFKPHEVAFEEFLDQAGGGPAGGAAPPLPMAPTTGGAPFRPMSASPVPRPQVVESPPADANSGAAEGDFDLERAMADLNSNRILYATLTQLLSNRLIGLKNAIDSR